MGNIESNNFTFHEKENKNGEIICRLDAWYHSDFRLKKKMRINWGKRKKRDQKEFIQ